MAFLVISNRVIAQGPCAADPSFSPAITVPAAGGLSNFYWPGMSATATGSVHLEGNLTINNNLSISSAIFRSDAGVKIIVTSPYTLTIGNSTMSNCDNSMWEHITVEPGGHIIIQNASLVENAYQAVETQGTPTSFGQFRIQNSELLNNYIGVDVESTGAPHTGFITNTEISAPSLILPYTAGTHGYAGINIDNVTSGITIGNTAGSVGTTSDQNYIHDVEYGIYAYESVVYVQNNLFEDITPNTGSPTNRGVGIAAIGDPFSKGELFVGYPNAGVTGPNNRLTDCKYAIVSLLYFNTYIDDNELIGSLSGTTATMYNGILLDQNQPTGTVSVTDNLIEEFLSHGILDRMSSANTNIDNNTIRNVLIDHNSTYKVTGIQLRDFGFGTATIEYNDVDHVQRGIELYNSKAVVKGNQVDFFLPITSTIAAFGIHVEGATDVDVLDNHIYGNCPSCAISGPVNVRGMELEVSPGFLADGNFVYEASVGILATGSNIGGNFTCNLIDDCTKGFGLQNIPSVPPPPSVDIGLGPITSNAGLPDAAGNRWSPATTANRTYAFGSSGGTDANLLEWYYNASFGSTYDMPLALNTEDGGPSTTLTPISSTYIPCDIPPLAPPSGGSGSAVFSGSYLNSMIASLSSSVDRCNNYAQRRFVYEYFTSRPAELTANPEYKKLYDAASDAVFKTFSAVDSAVYNQDWSVARLLNNAVVPHCPQDVLLQEVMRIYLSGVDSVRTIEQALGGELPYSASDLKRLHEIASMSGLKDNPAVYRARALVDRQDVSDASFRESAALQGEIQTFSGSITVYPQPASEMVTVILPDQFEEGVSVELFDRIGRLVRSYGNTNDLNIQLSVSGIESGIYILRLTNESGQSLSRSITVQ